MLKLGAVERAIYDERAKAPLVIPQVDPSCVSETALQKLLTGVKALGLSFVAIGGTVVSSAELQTVLDIAVKDFGLTCLVYPTSSSIFNTRGIKGKSALYWMSVPNAENPYFVKDMLIGNSIVASKSNYELIPTTYVFDDRGSVEAAMWLSRANPVPRHKSYLSLSIALAAEYSGARFYIMAGGSGCDQIPPTSHISLLRERTTLFILPTSGIRTGADAEKVFAAGGDAIHVGHALEQPNGLLALKDMVAVAKKFPGKTFG